MHRGAVVKVQTFTQPVAKKGSLKVAIISPEVHKTFLFIMFRDEVATEVKSNIFEDETLCLIYLGKVALKTNKDTVLTFWIPKINLFSGNTEALVVQRL